MSLEHFRDGHGNMRQLIRGVSYLGALVFSILLAGACLAALWMSLEHFRDGHGNMRQLIRGVSYLGALVFSILLAGACLAALWMSLEHFMDGHGNTAAFYLAVATAIGAYKLHSRRRSPVEPIDFL